MLGLASHVPGNGSHIFEASRVVIDGELCKVHCKHGPTVTADHVISAPHAPLNRMLLQSKVSPYRS